MAGSVTGDATRYLAFDLETTGTNAESDHIVEFCFIELDGELQEKARWSGLVRPPVPIPPETTKIHHITDEMVTDKPMFAHYAARIQKLVAGPDGQTPAVLIGHNVRFDVQFLHHALQRAKLPGLRVDHPTIDTSYLEALIHPRNLGALYEKYAGKPLDDAHRSEADTAATVEVLRGQLQAHGGKEIPPTLEDLQTEVLRRARDPDRHRAWLDHGRRFYADGQGMICFGFGKHRDRPASEELDYLRWMQRQSFPPEVQKIIQQVLASTQAAATAPGQQHLEAGT